MSEIADYIGPWMYKFAGYTGPWLYRLYRVDGYIGLLDIQVTGSIGKQDVWGNRICRGAGSIGQQDL